MKPSQNHVLKRLDEWYLDRVATHYTDGLAKRLLDGMVDALRPDMDGSEISLLIATGAFSFLDPQERIKDATGYFSTLEDVCRSYSLQRVQTANPASTEAGEFIQAYCARLVQTVARFTDGARKLCRDDIFFELSDGKIAELFGAAFGGVEGYASFWQDGLEAYHQVSRARDGDRPPEECRIRDSVHRAFKSQLPIIAQALFGEMDRPAP